MATQWRRAVQYKNGEYGPKERKVTPAERTYPGAGQSAAGPAPWSMDLLTNAVRTPPWTGGHVLF